MKIIATDISNLTDARYFAAWNVDMMCYSIDEGATGSLSIAQVKEIANWVEGPATGIKMTGLSVPTDLSDLDVNVQGLIIGPFIDTVDLPSVNANATVYRIGTLSELPSEKGNLILTLEVPVGQLSMDQKTQIRGLAEDREVYIDGTFVAADLAVIEELAVTGIILKGGDEEKVGYKSFDELDEILEAIFDD